MKQKHPCCGHIMFHLCMAVTHIVSLLTEVAMVVAALMAAVAMAVEGSVAGFATGSGCDGRGCFRQGNGGSTSSI